MSVVNAADSIIDQEILDQRINRKENAYCEYDPIQSAILPALHICKQMMQPINMVLFDSLETKIINGVELQCVRVGFLPFYTNFWCTSVRISIEAFAQILYVARDRYKYNCSIDDANHQERVKKLSDCTHILLKRAQYFIEGEITRRQKLTAQWIEFALDGAIFFLESA